jgi:hypothetical protein
VNYGSRNGGQNDIEKKLIDEALYERCARGEIVDRRLVQVIVQQITLATGGGWGCVVDIVSVSRGPCRRRREADLHTEAEIQASVECILADPRFSPSRVIGQDGNAVRTDGGRNMTWATRSAAGVWIDGAGSPMDCFAVLARCSLDGSPFPLCFVA